MVKDTLENRLALLANQFAAQVAVEVRAAFAAQVQSLVGGTSTQATPGREGGKRRGGGAGSRNFPKTCIAEGCRRPAKGPRFSFLCMEHHGEMSKTERKAATAAYKERRASEKRAG